MKKSKLKSTHPKLKHCLILALSICFMIVAIPASLAENSDNSQTATLGQIDLTACSPSEKSSVRARELYKLQNRLTKALSGEIASLVKKHNETLEADRRVQLTPQMDLAIDLQGHTKWTGVYTSEAQVWGYMSHYTTSLDSSWLPFKWGIFGRGFETPEQVYGYMPSEVELNVKRVLAAYPKAIRYIEDREAALKKDEKLKKDLRGLIVSTIFSMGLNLPTTGVLTFASVSHFAWESLSDQLRSYFKGIAEDELKQLVEEMFQVNSSEIILGNFGGNLGESNETSENIDGTQGQPGAKPETKIEEVVRKQVAIAMELIDPIEAQKIISMIYSLHYVTRDKLHSLGDGITMASERGPIGKGADEIDLASWLNPTLEVLKSTETEVSFLRTQRKSLEKKCLAKAAAAIAIAKPSRSVQALKGGDLAYANLIKQRAECLTNQYYLSTLELKWLGELGELSQAVCQKLKMLENVN